MVAGPIVAVTASAGGVEALSAFVHYLPAQFPAPVLIAQHFRQNRESHLREVLQRCTNLAVRWAREEQPVLGGVLYLSPPGRHLEVTPENNLRLSPVPGTQGAPTAANVLFRSVAASYGERAVGIILTGCLYDGAVGAVAIRQAGGRVFVQEPETCPYASMPLAAMQTGAVDLCLPVRALAAAVTAMALVPGVSSFLAVGPTYRRALAARAQAHPERFYFRERA